MATPFSQEKMQQMNKMLAERIEKMAAAGQKHINILSFEPPEKKGYLYDLITNQITQVQKDYYEFEEMVKEKYAPRDIKPTDVEWPIAVELSDRISELRRILEPIYYHKGIPELSEGEPIKWQIL